MIFQEIIVVVQLFFENCWLKDQIKSEVTVSEDQELVIFVDSGVDQGLPVVTLDHIKHLVYDATKNKQASHLWLQVQDRVLFVNLDESVLA